jgi:formylglycine-generating enzyme required for sulfatase activity
MDKYEVTNKLFDAFVRATGYRTTAEREGSAYDLTSEGKWEMINGASWRKPEGGDTVFVSNRENHPVVSVSWKDADAYCRWAGGRLPTEAEFEYADRAGTQTDYWWGNGSPGSRRVANIADETLKRKFSNGTIMTGYDDGYIRTAPVGSFEANPFGLHDTTGNVWEWTADWYGKDYYEFSPPQNPKGPSSGQSRVRRGGSWPDAPRGVRSAARRWTMPTNRNASLGFRCAQDAR